MKSSLRLREAVRYHQHYHQQRVNGVPPGSIRDCREVPCAVALGLWLADDHQLLKELGVSWADSTVKGMSRARAIECHHMTLYAIAELKEIQARLEADLYRERETDWRIVMERAMQAINCVTALAVYARTGKGGGTSALQRH